MRQMYDAVNPENIPTTAEMVAGYIDGRYAWSAAGWARFPHAVPVRIAVLASTNDGVVADVETANMSPAAAVAWVKRRRAAGVDPSLYCNASTWTAVKAAFAAAQEPDPHFWIAHWDVAPTVPAGAVALQYQAVGPYDLSVVDAYWPGVDPVVPDLGPTQAALAAVAQQVASLAATVGGATTDAQNALKVLQGSVGGDMTALQRALAQLQRDVAAL